ncbi:MAG: hypothetical protein ACLFUC_06965 [Bacteroidales bacterium]
MVNQPLEENVDVRKKTGGIILLECYFDGEGPLFIMEPVLRKLFRSFQSRIFHYRLKLTPEHPVAREFHLSDDINYLIYRDGNMMGLIRGMLPLHEFIARLEELLTSNH